MPSLILPQVNSGISTDELGDIVAKGFKDIEWITSGFMDSKNIRNIAGFNVGNTELKHISGIVGMSGYDAANPLAVRFWSGNADKSIAPFRVLQNGKMYATDGEFTGKITAQSGTIGGFTISLTKLSGAGIIEGGTLRTAASGARIELSSNSLRTFNASGNLNGPSWGNGIGAGEFGDTYWYHDNVQLMRIYDEITNYRIQGLSTLNPIKFGSTLYPSQGDGAWTFSSSSGSVDMQGAFKVHSGTSFDTLSQSDSTATDVPGIVSDFNSLLSKLRSMNILA